MVHLNVSYLCIFGCIKGIIAFCTYFKVFILLLKVPPLPLGFIHFGNVTCQTYIAYTGPLLLCHFMREGLTPYMLARWMYSNYSFGCKGQRLTQEQRSLSSYCSVGLETNLSWQISECLCLSKIHMSKC